MTDRPPVADTARSEEPGTAVGPFGILADGDAVLVSAAPTENETRITTARAPTMRAGFIV